MEKTLDLSCIRVATEHDLGDAHALATHLLVPNEMDFVTRQFSFDLLVAVLLTTAYGKEEKTLDQVLFFLADPRWDSAKQILNGVANEAKGIKQPGSADWCKSTSEKLLRTAGDHDTAEGLIKRCHAHWQIAFAQAGAIKTAPMPPSAIEIFDLEAVSKAAHMVSTVSSERRAGADQILENARFDGGYRLVPDARRACEQLEKTKARFENLAEPISRLQTDLVLAAAMPPMDFQITPILLLGEPGIGKTYLAMQLADALGVATEKISAGGGHANFQLTGSHPTWTESRPGLIAALLAQGKSTSPVMVIDEVDKIAGDSRYPMLPLLLDLLEPDTAKKFQDQFLGLEFDASRIIFILTANTLDGIPPALLSRVDVFHVPRPERAQRLRIIRQTHANLCAKTEQKISLDEGSCTVLASRTDLDIRKLMRLVREAFAKALQTGRTVAELVMPALEFPDADAPNADVGRKLDSQKRQYH